MKLLYCTQCGDMIAPYRGNYRPRYCCCERFAVWWRDGDRGQLSVHDTEGSKCGAWVLGITNSFLQFPLISMTPEVIQEIIDSHGDNYLFKTLRSCIVRISPGGSNDTQWEDAVPKGDLIDKPRKTT